MINIFFFEWFVGLIKDRDFFVVFLFFMLLGFVINKYDNLYLFFYWGKFIFLKIVFLYILWLFLINKLIKYYIMNESYNINLFVGLFFFVNVY